MRVTVFGVADIGQLIRNDTRKTLGAALPRQLGLASGGLENGRTQCCRFFALCKPRKSCNSAKSYPHKYAEAGARTRDLPVTDGRLYRCTRPALPIKWKYCFPTKFKTHLHYISILIQLAIMGKIEKQHSEVCQLGLVQWRTGPCMYIFFL